MTSAGQKPGVGRKCTKNDAFFILLATFGKVRRMVLTLNFKLKLIYIILTFVVIYVSIEDFEGEKHGENISEKMQKGWENLGTNIKV